MKVRAIDGDRAAGQRLLAVVTQHADPAVVPEGSWASQASEGRLMDATGDVWFIEDGGLRVARVHFIPGKAELAEVTTYQDGVEISRIVGPTS